MKSRILMLAFFLFSTLAQAEDALLRIRCVDEAADAAVTLNGKPKGECPLDLSLPPGNYKLRVTKKIDAMHDGVYEKDLLLSDGIAKAVDVTLSSSLNAEGKKQQVQQVADAASREQDVTSIPGKFVSIPGKPWKIMAYEVTFAQWDQCVADGGCNDYSPKDEGWGRGDRPVINVSPYDIKSYVQWLNGKTGKKFRLPLEEEWEYAARGSTTTDYWWGATASHEYANYGLEQCCGGLAQGKDQWINTSPVGSFPANPYGLYDTAGNVEEWTEGCWEDNCWTLVTRGGCHISTPKLLQVSYRGKGGSASRYEHTGFRLVQDN